MLNMAKINSLSQLQSSDRLVQNCFKVVSSRHISGDDKFVYVGHHTIDKCRYKCLFVHALTTARHTLAGFMRVRWGRAPYMRAVTTLRTEGSVNCLRVQP